MLRGCVDRVGVIVSVGVGQTEPIRRKYESERGDVLGYLHLLRHAEPVHCTNRVHNACVMLRYDVAGGYIRGYL